MGLIMTPSAQFILIFGSLLLSFHSAASQLSDITLLTPTETRQVKFSADSGFLYLCNIPEYSRLAPPGKPAEAHQH